MEDYYNLDEMIPEDRIKAIRKEIKKGEEVHINELLRDEFDDNYYGELDLKFFGKKKFTIESIWTDWNEEDNNCNPIVKVHVSCEEFEGDLEVDTLSNENILAILKMIERHEN